MQAAVAYIRVSTEAQAVEGVSLEAQEAKIRAWCQLHDYTLQSTHVDAGVSGKKVDNRPALQEALAACQKGGALVVYSLSRLARSTADTLAIAEQLQRKSADLVSLSEKIDTTSAAGKMVFRMLAVLSEFERDQISERTSAAMQHKRSKRERVGAVPYGFDLAENGVDLVANVAEQKIVKVVKRGKARGLTLQAIGDQLAAKGFKPKGKKWYPQTIKNILAAA